MSRAVMTMVAFALGVNLAAPADAGQTAQKAEPQKVAVFKQWSGWYTYPTKDVKLPWFEAKQDFGIIDNAKTFEAVWKVWSKEEEGKTPKVDFQKYLVLFHGKDAIAISLMKGFALDAEGTLTFLTTLEANFMRPPGSIHMHMVVIPRAGIKAVNTGNGVFEVPPLTVEKKEAGESAAARPRAAQLTFLRADEAEDRAVTFVQGFGGKVDRSEAEGPITVVVLKGTPLVDSDLKQLGGLKALRVLSLQGTRITDAGLKELSAFKELKELDLRATKVTGAGFKGLAALAELRWLDLAETKVTGAGLKELAAVESLEELNLGGTALTSADLKELAALKELRWLSLSNTKVADADLKGLAALAELRTLFLFGSAVTDAGLKELAPMKRLRLVDVGETKVTGAGIAWLTKALPDCDVLR